VDDLDDAGVNSKEVVMVVVRDFKQETTALKAVATAAVKVSVVAAAVEASKDAAAAASASLAENIYCMLLWCWLILQPRDKNDIKNINWRIGISPLEFYSNSEIPFFTSIICRTDHCCYCRSCWFS
jgi:hypothetical protein